MTLRVLIAAAALCQLASAGTVSVSLDTSALIGHPAGPFSLDFQITDGSGRAMGIIPSTSPASCSIQAAPQVRPDHAKRGDEQRQAYRGPERPERRTTIAPFGLPPAEPAPNIDREHSGDHINPSNTVWR